MDIKTYTGLKNLQSNYSEDTNLAAALGNAFELGAEAFKEQLALLSDQQYVELLTLLDEYTGPLRP